MNQLDVERKKRRIENIANGLAEQQALQANREAHAAAKPETKRRRMHTKTPWQLEQLEAFFEEDSHYPDVFDQRALALRLDLHEKQVQFWFQNRRAKWKRAGGRQSVLTDPMCNIEVTPPPLTKLVNMHTDRQPQALAQHQVYGQVKKKLKRGVESERRRVATKQPPSAELVAMPTPPPATERASLAEVEPEVTLGQKDATPPSAELVAMPTPPPATERASLAEVEPEVTLGQKDATPPSAELVAMPTPPPATERASLAEVEPEVTLGQKNVTELMRNIEVVATSPPAELAAMPTPPPVAEQTVELATGEEDEKVLFCERAKLFRWNAESNEYKERGLGDLKILLQPTTGRRRVLMRREHVHKICANHCIASLTKLRPLKTGARAWVWRCVDYADGERRNETLAVRFKTPDMAADFERIFDAMAFRAGPDKWWEGKGFLPANAPVATIQVDDVLLGYFGPPPTVINNN